MPITQVYFAQKVKGEKHGEKEKEKKEAISCLWIFSQNKNERLSLYKADSDLPHVEDIETRKEFQGYILARVGVVTLSQIVGDHKLATTKSVWDQEL